MYKKTIKLIIKYFIIVYYKQLHIKKFQVCCDKFLEYFFSVCHS